MKTLEIGNYGSVQKTKSLDRPIFANQTWILIEKSTTTTSCS